MGNKIISRYYIAANIVLASPLSLSGGNGEHTDSDVMCDGEGRPLIPGSSIAGAFRRYLRQKKNEGGIFGYSAKNAETGQQEGYMSTLFFSDVYFEGEEGNAIVSERDGVKLSEEKTVDNKFDYEIVETGARACMRIEKVFREGDAKKGFEDGLGEIQLLLSALDKGEIRFGARKNDGCGWVQVEKVHKQVFGISEKASGADQEKQGAYLRWMEFCNAENPWDGIAPWEDWRTETEEQFVSIKIPLRLTGGISIRKYATCPNKADFEHITVRGRTGEGIPVIPGSSWKGAIRSCAKNILQELGIPGIQEKLDEWFGMVKTGQNAKQSMVVVKESQLEDSVPMASTRNKVNRFDASTVEGALYTEKAYFGGRTTLQILVRKTEEEVYYPLLGLLSLAVQEIEEGYLAVGGQTAVGRGIFEADTGASEQKTLWSEEINRTRCLQELAALKGGR